MSTATDTEELQLAPPQENEPPMKQLAPFSTMEQEARKMIASAESIALLPPTPANANVARTMRLQIKPLCAAADKARIEREEFERVAKAEREAEKKRTDEEYRKAKEAQDAADAVVRKKREAREKLEAEIAASRAAESKLHAENAAREQAAAAAPEKEKLKALAKTIRDLPVPQLTTEKGVAAMGEIAAKVEAFAGWIEKKGAAL